MPARKGLDNLWPMRIQYPAKGVRCWWFGGRIRRPVCLNSVMARQMLTTIKKSSLPLLRGEVFSNIPGDYGRHESLGDVAHSVVVVAA